MTAAERAAEVIYAMLDDEHAVVACLMADPALLVDLAIEAGGLERCVIDGFHLEFLGHQTYRRTTQENDRP